jgi:uncharacterized protein (TIGR02996 family)
MTTNSDAAAFLRAYLAAPHDPLPLLVFADRLDEQGDRRGTLLRRRAGVYARQLRACADALRAMPALGRHWYPRASDDMLGYMLRKFAPDLLPLACGPCRLRYPCGCHATDARRWDKENSP